MQNNRVPPCAGVGRIVGASQRPRLDCIDQARDKGENSRLFTSRLGLQHAIFHVSRLKGETNNTLIGGQGVAMETGISMESRLLGVVPVDRELRRQGVRHGQTTS